MENCIICNGKIKDAGIQRTYQIGFDTGLPVYLQIENTALEE